jgi:hypothetical protein
LQDDLYTSGRHNFFWQVSVMAKTGEKDDGTWTGDEISPRSEQRTFIWQ